MVTCLTSADNLYATDTTLSYIAPTEHGPGQAGGGDARAEGLGGRGQARRRARTGDNLGTKYPKISEPMWTAVQAALSGSKSPQAALSAAQSTAAAATR